MGDFSSEDLNLTKSLLHRWGDILILPLLILLAYSIVFVYEAGFCKATGIPFHATSPSFTTMFSVATKILSILAIASLFVILLNLTLSERLKHKFDWSFYALGPILMNLFFWMPRWDKMQFSVYLLLIILLVVIAAEIYSLYRPSKKAKKHSEPSTPSKPKSTIERIEARIGMPLGYLYLIVQSFISSFSVAGQSEIFTRRVFPVLAADTTVIVLRIYGEKVYTTKLLPYTGSLSKVVTVRSLDTLAFAEADLGYLVMKQ